MKIIILSLLAITFMSFDVEACSCKETTLSEQLERADYVFISKIISKEHEYNWFSENRTLYKHEVLKPLKGNLTEFTYSYVPDSKTSCDYEPEMNIERVVIITGKPPFRLAGCLYGGDRVKFEKIHPNWLSSFNKSLQQIFAE